MLAGQIAEARIRSPVAIDVPNLRIVLYPDPSLRVRAKDVASVTDEVRTVAEKMITLMFEADGIGLKLTTEISGVTRLLAAVRQTAQRHDVQVDVRGSASGVLYAGLAGGTDSRQVAAVVEDLRAAATPGAGSVVVLTAPAQVREALDMWGPVPGLHLMRRLKDELDPEHRLSPGRYVGGI